MGVSLVLFTWLSTVAMCPYDGDDAVPREASWNAWSGGELAGEVCPYDVDHWLVDRLGTDDTVEVELRGQTRLIDATLCRVSSEDIEDLQPDRCVASTEPDAQGVLRLRIDGKRGDRIVLRVASKPDVTRASYAPRRTMRGFSLPGFFLASGGFALLAGYLIVVTLIVGFPFTLMLLCPCTAPLGFLGLGGTMFLVILKGMGGNGRPYPR